MPGRRTFLVGGGCTAFIKVSCVHSLRLRILTFSRKAESYKDHGRRTSTFFIIEIRLELNKILHNRWALRLLPKLSSMPVFQASSMFRLRQVTISDRYQLRCRRGSFRRVLLRRFYKRSGIYTLNSITRNILDHQHSSVLFTTSVSPTYPSST